MTIDVNLALASKCTVTDMISGAELFILLHVIRISRLCFILSSPQSPSKLVRSVCVKPIELIASVCKLFHEILEAK